VRLVVSSLDGWDAGALKTIASSIVERAGYVVVLFGAPPPAAIVVARSADVGLDSAAVLRKVTERFGGKGGGRPELAQGGGVTGSIAEAIEFAKRTIQEP
jgi:alanyl-tRNA synthetase